MRRWFLASFPGAGQSASHPLRRKKDRLFSPAAVSMCNDDTPGSVVVASLSDYAPGNFPPLRINLSTFSRESFLLIKIISFIHNGRLEP